MAMAHVEHGDKWTAFWLSLLVPGAGQLWLKRWSCVAWFVLAGGVGAAFAAVAIKFPPANVAGIAALLIVGALSAENAKRCSERTGWFLRSGRIRWRVQCSPLVDSKVSLDIKLRIPQSRDEVWKVVGDLPRFLCVDPFHSHVAITGNASKPTLLLEHRVFGLRFHRTGRLLRWTPGMGYSFSDFSMKGPHRGFPHVFHISLEEAALRETLLTIAVRGRWTMRWLPRRFAAAWLHYVCRQHARQLAEAF